MANGHVESAAVLPEAAPNNPNLPRGLRVSEAAVYIGATINFVRTLIANREIPAIKLGKRFVLLREDLDEFLDAQRRRA